MSQESVQTQRQLYHWNPFCPLYIFYVYSAINLSQYFSCPPSTFVFPRLTMALLSLIVRSSIEIEQELTFYKLYVTVYSHDYMILVTHFHIFFILFYHFFT